MVLSQFSAAVACWLSLIFTNSTHGFLSNSVSSPVVRRHQPAVFQRRRSAPQSLDMCICIDCARVPNCSAYHFVEIKHEQPHMTDDPTFTPQEGSPTIHVNVRTVRSDSDKEQAARMWQEHEAETAKAQDSASSSPETESLHGETVYDLTPVTTYEYDVVKCQDFVQDTGCWIRNMPREIREANPDFVPS